MKAILLAAGLGTRLRPLTLTTPKPLLPIAGRPLLAYHLESLAQAGVTEVLINTHYLSEQIEAFVAAYPDDHLTIKTTYEQVMLGSAGTVRENQEFFGDEPFLIVYADNLTNINYQALIKHHLDSDALVTIASYEEEHPEQKGIIEFNEDTLTITRFVEKPKPGETTSRFANAGIYMSDARLFAFLKPVTNTDILDFGYHIFPSLLASGQVMRVYPMCEQILDIGTPDSYTEAQTLVQRMFNKEGYI